MADLNLAIMGCGNPNRSDDGVGSYILEQLASLPLPRHAHLYDMGTDGMGAMYRARGVSHLIVVDAKIPEDNPGAIYEVPGEILQSPPQPSLNLHDFRWDNALYVGKKIYGNDFPQFVKIFLIEAQSLALDIGLSQKVERAAQEITDRIASLSHTISINGWEIC